MAPQMNTLIVESLRCEIPLSLDILPRRSDILNYLHDTEHC